MEHRKPVDTRFRLKPELHELLKEIAKKEDRSMNYLMNKAVELLLNRESESMKSIGTKKPCPTTNQCKVQLPSLKDVNTCLI